MKRTMLVAACLGVLLAAGMDKASAETLPAGKGQVAFDLKAPVGETRDKWCRQIGTGLWECESCQEDEIKQQSYCTIAIEYRDP